MKIMVVTTTRADYGIMSDLLGMLEKSPLFNLRLVVTGTHLSQKFGYTVDEIIKDNLSIAHKVDFPLEQDASHYLAESVGKLVASFSSLIAQEAPDLLMVLGDRYEILAPVTAAVIQRVPVAHIHGGETTLGAIDNKIRHAVTQMADIHFTATASACSKVRALCPDNKQVYHVGSLSVDQISKMQLLARESLCEMFAWDISGETAIVTYHPETISTLSPDQQINQLIGALDDHRNLFTVITLSNADAGGQGISERLIEFGKGRYNVAVHESLGHRAYLSCLACFNLVVGNSSSGIIEAPLFGTPTVNIGDRQKGREVADSVISVPCERVAISKGIGHALETVEVRSVNHARLPYGKPNAASEIVSILGQLSRNMMS